MPPDYTAGSVGKLGKHRFTHIGWQKTEKSDKGVYGGRTKKITFAAPAINGVSDAARSVNQKRKPDTAKKGSV